MRNLVLVLALMVGLSVTGEAEAATWEIRGKTSLTNNSCPNAPRSMPINQRLQCTYGFCRVDDRTMGLAMAGVMPISSALLQQDFPLTNGCQLSVAYDYRNFNSRSKTVRLTQYITTNCTWGSCSSRYVGTVKYR